METAIHVTDLRVIKERQEILKGVSLEVEAGQIHGLLGPSGSGKTTLMRSIVGLQRITAGSIRVLGLPAGSKDLRSKVGYSTQSASIYGDMTAIENIRFFQALYPKTSRSAMDRLAEVHLETSANHMARTLSGGERTRLALATALVGEPELLILDEPTVGLDPLLREELWRMFRSIAQRGTTILVSSHVMDEASNCDRLILMRDGQVLARGTTSELREKSGQQEMEQVFISLVKTS